MSASRNSASASARATISSKLLRAYGSSCAARTHASGAGGRAAISSARRSSSKATGNPARDRAGRQIERLPDRAVALVAGEEAVENVLAVLGQLDHRFVDVESLVDLGERVLVGARGLGLVGRLFARPGSDLVDAQAPGQLGDPGLDRVVAPQRVEPLVDACEDLLEDILGILFFEPEALDRDRVDVAREPLHERRPRFLVAAAAAGHELRRRNRMAHDGPCYACCCSASRSRLAITCSSFQAISAFVSTSGLKSHDVRP
jgi:hypothetical protein